MLPKNRRLSAKEVRDVMKRGKGVRGVLVSIKFLQNQGMSKAAVVVSKSVARLAVERNKIRRTVYNVLESALPASGYAAVFFVQKNSPEAAEEIKKLCLKHF